MRLYLAPALAALSALAQTAALPQSDHNGLFDAISIANDEAVGQYSKMTAGLNIAPAFELVPRTAEAEPASEPSYGPPEVITMGMSTRTIYPLRTELVTPGVTPTCSPSLTIDLQKLSSEGGYVQTVFHGPSPSPHSTTVLKPEIIDVTSEGDPDFGLLARPPGYTTCQDECKGHWHHVPRPTKTTSTSHETTKTVTKHVPGPEHHSSSKSSSPTMKPSTSISASARVKASRTVHIWVDPALHTRPSKDATISNYATGTPRVSSQPASSQRVSSQRVSSQPSSSQRVSSRTSSSQRVSSRTSSSQRSSSSQSTSKPCGSSAGPCKPTTRTMTTTATASVTIVSSLTIHPSSSRSTHDSVMPGMHSRSSSSKATSSSHHSSMSTSHSSSHPTTSIPHSSTQSPVSTPTSSPSSSHSPVCHCSKSSTSSTHPASPSTRCPCQEPTRKTTTSTPCKQSSTLHTTTTITKTCKKSSTRTVQITDTTTIFSPAPTMVVETQVKTEIVTYCPGDEDEEKATTTAPSKPLATLFADFAEARETEIHDTVIRELFAGTIEQDDTPSPTLAPRGLQEALQAGTPVVADASVDATPARMMQQQYLAARQASGGTNHQEADTDRSGTGLSAAGRVDASSALLILPIALLVANYHL